MIKKLFIGLILLGLCTTAFADDYTDNYRLQITDESGRNWRTTYSNTITSIDSLISIVSDDNLSLDSVVIDNQNKIGIISDDAVTWGADSERITILSNDAVVSWTTPLAYSSRTASILQSSTNQAGYITSTNFNDWQNNRVSGDTLETSLLSRDASIIANQIEISALSDDSHTTHLSQDSAIIDNANSITILSNDALSQDSNIITNIDNIATISSDIAGLHTEHLSQDAAIIGNQDNISTISSDIAGIETDQLSQDTAIITNADSITIISNDIVGIETDQLSQDTAIITNEDSITIISNDIAAMHTEHLSQDAAIIANADNIAIITGDAVQWIADTEEINIISADAIDWEATVEKANILSNDSLSQDASIIANADNITILTGDASWTNDGSTIRALPNVPISVDTLSVDSLLMIGGAYGFPTTAPTVDGYVMSWDTTTSSIVWGSVAGGSGSTSPGGDSTMVQYNNAGSFDGASELLYVSGVLSADKISVDSTLMIGGNYEFPTDAPTVDGMVISYDTTTSSLVWGTNAEGGGGGVPGGDDPQIQFNDGGSFGGANSVHYDSATGALSADGISCDTTLVADYIDARNAVGYFMQGNKFIWEDASQGTFIGQDVGEEATDAACTYLGYNAGRYLAGFNNTCMGKDAGKGATGVSNGDRNTFIGKDAGRSITTGDKNTAVGNASLDGCQDGSDNMGFGFYTLGLGTSLIGNTAIGTQAGRDVTADYNVFIGLQAGMEVTTGERNVAIGHSSLQGADVTPHSASRNAMVGGEIATAAIAGCSDNSNLGYKAGNALTSGGQNVIIGSEAGLLITTGTNNVIMGHEVAKSKFTDVAMSNRLLIDNADVEFPLIYGDFTENIITINGDLSADTISCDGISIDTVITIPTGAAKGIRLGGQGEIYDNSADMIFDSQSDFAFTIAGADNTPGCDFHFSHDTDGAAELRLDNTNSGTDVKHTSLTFYDGGTNQAEISYNNNQDEWRFQSYQGEIWIENDSADKDIEFYINDSDGYGQNMIMQMDASVPQINILGGATLSTDTISVDSLLMVNGEAITPSPWTDAGSNIYPTVTADNVCVGTTTDAGTNGTGVLVFGGQTTIDPTTSPTGVVQLFGSGISAVISADVTSGDSQTYESGGPVTAGKEAIYFADDSTATSFNAAGNWDDATDGWRINFTAPKVVTHWEIYAGTEMDRVTAIRIYGTNSEAVGDLLDTNTRSYGNDTWYYHDFTNSTAYSSYSISADTSSGASIDWKEIVMYEEAEKAELVVRDENGNETTLSPHNFSNIPASKVQQIIDESNGLAWTYHSENDRGSITVDMFNAIKDLQEITGKKYIYKELK